MKNLKLYVVALLAAGVMFVAPSFIKAAVMVQGPTQTTHPIATTTTDWSGALPFSQFDPALGTLTEVTLTLSSNLDTIMTVTNNGGSSSSGTIKTELQISVWDPSKAFSFLGSQPVLDIIAPSRDYTLGVGGSYTSDLLTASGSTTRDYTDSSILSEFTGLGSLSLSATTKTYSLLANTGGNTTATQVTNAGADGFITYTYDSAPVAAPEPSMLAIFGFGAIGLVGYLWRRNRAVQGKACQGKV